MQVNSAHQSILRVDSRVIYSDLFASLNQSGFNFAIFDNLVVGEAVPEPSTLLLVAAACFFALTRKKSAGN